MKLIAVSGMLDSGKTTLIRELIVRLNVLGKRCGVIVNEDGIARYDEGFVRSHDIRVEPLRGG